MHTYTTGSGARGAFVICSLLFCLLRLRTIITLFPLLFRVCMFVFVLCFSRALNVLEYDTFLRENHINCVRVFFLPLVCFHFLCCCFLPQPLNMIRYAAILFAICILLLLQCYAAASSSIIYMLFEPFACFHFWRTPLKFFCGCYSFIPLFVSCLSLYFVRFIIFQFVLW